MAWNEFMMPTTVPNRPMNGPALAVVARNARYRSIRSTSLGLHAPHGTLDRLEPLGRDALLTRVRGTIHHVWRRRSAGRQLLVRAQ